MPPEEEDEWNELMRPHMVDDGPDATVPHDFVLPQEAARVQDEAEADYELIFSDSSGDTLLEFKKLSQTEVSVDELVDNINESLS